MAIRSMKIRLFPTKEQEQKFWQHIGASRFVYNYMLEEQNRRYKAGEKHMSAYDMHKMITVIKKSEDLSWLNNVSVATLQRSCSDLERAFNNFFNKWARYPRFKSKKRSRKSFPIRQDRTWFSESHVMIPSVGQVLYKTDFQVPLGTKRKFIDPRIQYTANGKWILTIGIERENQAPILTDKSMGIDLGIKELAVVSFGEEEFVFHNINKSRKMRQLERKLKHLQRNVSRKYEYSKRRGKSYEKSNNILKEEQKIKKLQYHIANIRDNYRHQITHELVSLLPNVVVMEDLNVMGMMKNRHLSKAIAQQGFCDFIFKTKYKAEELGIEFLQADKFYPSSKTCSECGAIKSDLTLNDRTYICKECGSITDRDLNAAKNLANYVSVKQTMYVELK